MGFQTPVLWRRGLCGFAFGSLVKERAASWQDVTVAGAQFIQGRPFLGEMCKVCCSLPCLKPWLSNKKTLSMSVRACACGSKNRIEVPLLIVGVIGHRYRTGIRLQSPMPFMFSLDIHVLLLFSILRIWVL